MTLKNYRIMFKLTQSDMAKRLKMSQPNYSKLETGEHRASTDRVNQIIGETRGLVGYKALRPDIYNNVLKEGHNAD